MDHLRRSRSRRQIVASSVTWNKNRTPIVAQVKQTNGPFADHVSNLFRAVGTLCIRQQLRQSEHSYVRQHGFPLRLSRYTITNASLANTPILCAHECSNHRPGVTVCSAGWLSTGGGDPVNGAKIPSNVRTTIERLAVAWLANTQSRST
jgi:hypothetical protein